MPKRFASAANQIDSCRLRVRVGICENGLRATIDLRSTYTVFLQHVFASRNYVLTCSSAKTSVVYVCLRCNVIELLGGNALITL